MQNDEFAMEDLDDEKTIAYIREHLPQELKDKFSDNDFYYILDSNDEYIDIDINKIAEYVAKEAKKDGIGEYDPEELFFVIEGELAYNGILEE